MSSIDEKRVHGANTDATALFVASDIGLVRVTVAGERVGNIELTDRRAAHDLAVSETHLAVATDEDVLLLTEETTAETGFGPATAVGFTDTLIAAAPDGTVAHRTENGWTELGQVESVRAIDNDLLGTEGGIYRFADGKFHYSGLDDVRDVATAGTPRAATATGLYRLGNGWMDELDGEFELVTADTDRAHAATADEFYAYDGEWTLEPMEKSVVGVAYTGAVYAVTADGTLLIETDDGWREHPLGVGNAQALVALDRKPV
ncbi:MAG TPA: hypothetical protein VFJ06_05050 [Halococcus sp.]|nr:hypothetical protein [Halococcus sp.]